MTRVLLIALVTAIVAVFRFGLTAWISFPGVRLSISLSWQYVPWMQAAIHAAYWLAKALFTVGVRGC